LFYGKNRIKKGDFKSYCIFIGMNASIAQLAKIAQKKERIIIGLMSGTSLDGLDIALCRIRSHGEHSQLELMNFLTMEYLSEFRERIRGVFAKRSVDQQLLSGLNPYIAQVHADLILKALKTWRLEPKDIDLIASHGQTVYHAPQSLSGDLSLPNSTLQLGDGDHIAVRTGIITLSDFRQKQLAAGGEGAPLAAYGDYLLFSNKKQHRILLNIGGISNFTFLPALNSKIEAYATDLGPGNTIMNQYMFSQFGMEMDQDAGVALSGLIHQPLLDALMEDPFLDAPFPKTTGPELFNLKYVEQALAKIGNRSILPQDIMATLNAFSAHVIIQGIKKATQGLATFGIYLSGGGLHNPLLVQQIQHAFQGKVFSFAELGLNPDAKEACLFAILANETLAGSPENVQRIQNSPAVCMGKISLPY